MGNASTEHSKQMRCDTAAEYQKKLTAANRLEIRNKDAAKIQAVKINKGRLKIVGLRAKGQSASVQKVSRPPCKRFG